jgi:hypothetical protein
MLLMESLWIYAGVAVIVAITVGGGKPTFLGVAAIVAISFTISRWLQGTEVSLGILRFWGALLSLLVFYVVVRIDFFGDFRLWDFSWADDLFNHTEATIRDGSTAVIGVPVLAVLWVRGVLRGQQSILFDDVVRGFAVGLMVVAMAALVAGINEDLPREVDFLVVPYVAVGLLAIGLAHASRAVDEFDRSFSSTWILAVGGAVVGLGLIALLFVVVNFDMARDGLVLIANGVAYVAAGIFYVVLWPVFKAVELGFEGIRWLMQLWGGDRPQQEDTGQGQGQPPPEKDSDSIVPGWVGLIIRVFVATGIVGAILIGLALLFTRLRKAPKSGEVRESTYQEGRLAADLGNLIDSFFGRFRGRGIGAGVTDPARRLYFDMLNAAANRGVERRPTETPLEFSPRIGRTFSGPVPGEITQLFADARYGAVRAPDEQVRRLRDDWEHIPK